MTKFTCRIATLMLLSSIAVWADSHVPVPEIDASSSVAALTLLSGAVVVMRSRMRRK
jgi:hypothetical protein